MPTAAATVVGAASRDGRCDGRRLIKILFCEIGKNIIIRWEGSPLRDAFQDEGDGRREVMGGDVYLK